MSDNKRRILITGATSGLGKEMAIQLGQQGFRIAITGRRESFLSETASQIEKMGGEVLPLMGSVTDITVVQRHYAEIKTKWGGLDWAILNAGIAETMDTKHLSPGYYKRIFETNVLGVTNWMEAVLGDMLTARSGVIVGIASLAAFRGFPQSGAYCASKTALITLLESSRVDLYGTGVDVVIVCPGFVKSEMTDRHDPKTMLFLMETKAGAACILRGIERRCRRVYFPWQLSLLTRYLVRFLPDCLYDRLAARILKKRQGVRPK